MVLKISWTGHEIIDLIWFLNDPLCNQLKLCATEKYQVAKPFLIVLGLFASHIKVDSHSELIDLMNSIKVSKTQWQIRALMSVIQLSLWKFICLTARERPGGHTCTGNIHTHSCLAWSYLDFVWLLVCTWLHDPSESRGSTFDLGCTQVTWVALV